MIKKYFLARAFACWFVVFGLAFSATAGKSERNDRSMAISASPLSPLFGGIDLLFQHKMTDHLALTVPAYFAYNWLASALINNSGKETMSLNPINYGVGIGARFLMANKGLNDTFYIEPRVKLTYMQIGISGSESKILAITPTVLLGYDWYFSSGFSLGLGIGAGLNYYLSNNTELAHNASKEVTDAFNKWLPDNDSKIGFAWDGEFHLGYSW